jgi:nicotinate-nucleotide--dimethylbenzimidazole phosphoribosyltransferase
MAGDHGVVEEGVSAYPQEVTPQMVYNFLRGGAGINVIANHVNAQVRVVDMGVAVDLEANPELIIKKIGYGTKNMTKGHAMTREEAIASIEAGIDIVGKEVAKGTSIIGTGDMGIGNTTPSTAILAAFSKLPLSEIVGRGTGVDDESLNKKIKAIKTALEVNQPDPNDAIDVLSKVGGFEIGGLVGCIIGAASNRVPVVIDGFISGAAALVASKLEPKTIDYMIASHISVEPGHKKILQLIGLWPMLYMDMRLGEGTGAALGISMVEAGCKILCEMATFAEAGVSEAVENVKH